MAKKSTKQSSIQRTKKSITQRNIPAPGSESTPRTPKPLALQRRKSTKIAAVISLLGSPTGATIPQVTKATGWQPHTVRAALTGLRKRGYDVTSAKADKGERRYRCTQVPPASASKSGHASTSR